MDEHEIADARRVVAELVAAIEAGRLAATAAELAALVAAEVVLSHVSVHKTTD